MYMSERRRLFVPLARDPYNWFASGLKQWEVRRERGAFTRNHVSTGRRAELRKGYADRASSLWGTVLEVLTAASLDRLVERIPPRLVVPTAEHDDAAIAEMSTILGVNQNDQVSIIGLRIELDREGTPSLQLNFAPEYRQLVLAGTKTTTVRRSSSRLRPGPVILHFGDGRSDLVGSIVATTDLTTNMLTVSHAHHDGFDDLDSLVAALQRHYPGLGAEDSLTIVEFTWMK